MNEEKSKNFKQKNQKISKSKMAKFQMKNQGISKSGNFKPKNQEISKSENQEISNKKIKKFQNDFGHYHTDIYPKNQKISNEKCGVTVRKNQEISKLKNFKQEEPEYYNSNGLSPNRAFEQGLISNEEFIGFIKGNVIKYVVRCDKKGNPIEDIDKAISYLQLLKKMVKK